MAPLTVRVVPHADDGVVNVRVTEKARAAAPRWEPADVLLGPFAVDAQATLEKTGAGATLKLGGGSAVTVTYAPFTLSMVDAGGAPLIVVNGKQLLHYERGRSGPLDAAAPSLPAPGLRRSDAASRGSRQGLDAVPGEQQRRRTGWP